jgi:hypothetical protein
MHRQLPTRLPNDPIVFLYNHFSAEIARLNRIITDLHGRLTAPAPSVHTSAIGKLKQRLPEPVACVLRKLGRMLLRRPRSASGAP